MIVTGGENVYSIEVENALHEHPAVLECAVFGLPDETWGEAVHAAVVLRAGAHATPAELVEFVRARIAAYKAPRTLELLHELPKTGSGKISKQLLRVRSAAREPVREA
jgi:acyl-CoA synthetase (AMP-forming)/AMP-acid ligase II